MAAVMVVAAAEADLTAVVVAEADFTVVAAAEADLTAEVAAEADFTAVVVAEVGFTAEVAARHTTPEAGRTEGRAEGPVDMRRAVCRDMAARAEWVEAGRE